MHSYLLEKYENFQIKKTVDASFSETESNDKTGTIDHSKSYAP